MNKNFLPSKKFVHRLLIIIAVLAIILSISQLIKFLKNKNQNKTLTSTRVVVKDIVKKDSNFNGIADWEESIWGLDPYKNGDLNKEFIMSKRALLENENIFPIKNTEEINETELMSRDIFALILALESSGDLNEANIESISEMIGENIEILPFENKYNNDSLTIIEASEKNHLIYFGIFSLLNDKYIDSGMGDELSLIGQGLANNDSSAFVALNSVASAYRLFGEELMKMPIPEDMKTDHVDLANNYEKVALSIEQLTKISNDTMVGIKGFINYNKYIEEIVFTLEKLSSYSQ